MSRRCKKAVAAGQVSALYVFDPGPEGSIGTSMDHRGAPPGAAPAPRRPGRPADRLARAADFVLPGASYVEKEASYTNGQGRLQGTARAIPPPGDAMEDWQILVEPRRSRSGCRSITRAPRRSAPPSPRGSPTQRPRGDPGARLQPAGVGTPLAAGVEPVGAVEVGFHVPGSAAGERRRRSDGAAVPPGTIPLKEVK